jgi:hypothetical protein
MKTYLLLGILLSLSLSTFAQNRYVPALARTFGRDDIYSTNSNDPEDKDISIMTGILSKLVQQEFNNGDTAINIERIRGSYIPGSGILFTINQRAPFYRSPMAIGVTGRVLFPNRYGITFPGQQGKVMNLGNPNSAKAPAKTLERNNGQKLLETESPALVETTGDPTLFTFKEEGMTTYGNNGTITLSQNENRRSPKIQDSVFAAKIPRMKKVLEKFLAEYTILLSKLKPEEKIWVTWTIKEDYWGIDQGKMACELSSRMVKQDMLDLRAGKLDQVKFAEKIQYSVTRCAEQTNNPDLDIFTAILERLFTSDKSFDLYQLRAVNADAVGGFGYVFKLSFSPEIVTALLKSSPDGLAEKNAKPSNKQLTQEEIDQQIKGIKEAFPKLLLEYGRILKGLQNGEILKVDVSISDNYIFGGITKQLSFVVPQAVIRNFDAEKISMEEAVKQVKVEEK